MTYRGGYVSKESRLLMTQGGLSKFLKSIEVLPREVRPSVRDWARLIRNEAQSRAPVASVPIKRRHGTLTIPGTLRDAISYALFERGLAAVVGVFGRNRKKAWYAHFVENGTKPHFVQKQGGNKNNRLLLTLTRAGQHPGTRAQPFLQPAAVAAGPVGASKVIQAIQAALRKRAMTSSGNQLSAMITADAALSTIVATARSLQNSELVIPPFTGPVAQDEN